ncbi:MAG TPA: GGDEF domain-containing protein [Moraxellaceae bacterium]|nr:GGDEF domain-containing protein [Moraxellaceae bacterium]
MRAGWGYLVERLEALVTTRRDASGCLVLAVVMLPFLLLFLGLQGWALAHPEVFRLYEPRMLWGTQGVLAGAALFLCWVIAFTWPRYRSERARPDLVVAVTLVVGMALLVPAIGYGLKDTPMGIVLLGFLIIARTLFPARALRPVMAAGLLLILLNEGLRAIHVIRYAPLLTHPVFEGGALRPWWGLWLRIIYNIAIAFFCAVLFSLVRVKERRQLKLSSLARSDALTGLLNRVTFMRLLEDEGRKQERTGRPACVMMCDVDHFKRINDHYGHPAGDRVLVKLGELLKSVTRYPVDIPARYGGEEFVVLLPETGLDAAQQVAERIAESLRGERFVADGQFFTVTISIGVAPLVDGDGERALRVADEYLYAAKFAGRNRVMGARVA